MKSAGVQTRTTGDARAIALSRFAGSARAAAFAGIIGLALTGWSTSAWAQSASLDPTFGSGGRVTTDFARKADLAQGVAIQPDGKIVAVGWATVSGAYRFGVVRYNADGSLDTTFGSGGKVTTSFGAGVEDTASGVALQADGKIVVVGTTDIDGNLNYQFAIARYNVDGTPDTGFSGDGKTTVGAFIGTYNAGHAVAVQGDGKIVVAGFAGDSFIGGTEAFFGVARLTATGDLDTTFSGDGKATVDFGELYSNATAVVIQDDGKIVVAGTTDAGGNANFAVVRFDSTGNLDSSFGTDPGIPGQVTMDFFASDDFGQSVAVDAAGNIVVAGQAYGTDGIRTFALARYTSNGILDPSFSGDGLATTNFSSYESYALGVAVQADQKIVAVGGAQVAKRSSVVDFAVARFTSDGDLDMSFDTDGKVTTSFSSGADVASAVTLDGDGHIVAAGQAQDKNFALARYLD